MVDTGPIRERLVFSGTVQGVGFRYTCAHYAAELGITGWVRNEYDNTVVGEFQGTPAQINQLITQLKSGRFIRITNIAREPRETMLAESGFEITR